MSGIGAGQLNPNLLPAVSFVKAPAYQDGHAFYSDPIDEQQFLVKEINALEQAPDWSSTAVVIAYDDSDGWCDHVFSGVTNPSQCVADALTGTGPCGDTRTTDHWPARWAAAPTARASFATSSRSMLLRSSTRPG